MEELKIAVVNALEIAEQLKHGKRRLVMTFLLNEALKKVNYYLIKDEEWLREKQTAPAKDITQ